MWQLDWTKLADILTYDPRQPMIFSSGINQYWVSSRRNTKIITVKNALMHTART